RSGRVRGCRAEAGARPNGASRSWRTLESVAKWPAATSASVGWLPSPGGRAATESIWSAGVRLLVEPGRTGWEVRGPFAGVSPRPWDDGGRRTVWLDPGRSPDGVTRAVGSGERGLLSGPPWTAGLSLGISSSGGGPTGSWVNGARASATSAGVW